MSHLTYFPSVQTISTYAVDVVENSFAFHFLLLHVFFSIPSDEKLKTTVTCCHLSFLVVEKNVNDPYLICGEALSRVAQRICGCLIRRWGCLRPGWMRPWATPLVRGVPAQGRGLKLGDL